ncbi:heme biosynthesis HemY N-terminal domain-containing protein [Methylomicrobium sp. Wu6]|uniref:heme biosynthesis HemY N-terminal domain-containing protein n=1 Tax=Methylomicrobium sp. Wu6 TaxID=3107928 RepID=UPI002DD6A340|nr:heme biosynthesis HemY N-terminal domain-containing protein [Methylomicrobium sp. Wu6]MEC4749346.1 heme biosynthesis HemY N-terminal domain-containing protein [Methylomicrobium sp. Wu6]
MKKILYFLGPLFITLAAAFGVYYGFKSMETSGYVLVGIGHWSIETTLAAFTVALILAFFLLYVFFRFLGWLFRLPGQLKKRGTHIKFNRSQEALIAGLVDSAEGNWEQAEKILIKHASHSGAPLIHYLTAARAAQSRGAFDKRDEYLQKAADQAPGSNIAIGLTQAELHLSGNQFDQALETLTKLQSINPTHASVLKLLHQTYQHVGDWEAIRKLLPSLHHNKVLMETEVKLLETETFSRLLKQAAELGDANQIALLWSETPAHIKKMHGMAAIYFAAMIEAGAANTIENELAHMLSVNLDDTLLVLYGSVQSNDAAKQLATAEQWLIAGPGNAVLLSLLGKLCLHLGEREKAENYLTESLAAEPTVQAYQLLGDLYFELNEKDKSCASYKSALELSSSEIVTRLDQITEYGEQDSETLS